MRTCLFAVLALVIGCISCSKTGPAGSTGPQGPQGPQGSQGPQGPTGISGNANAMQYLFAEYDFNANAGVLLKIPTTRDTMNNSAWFAYLIFQDYRVIAIPGYNSWDGQTYDFTYLWNSNAGVEGMYCSIYRTTSGGGDSYKIKIVRIYLNKTISGNRNNGLPDLDFSNYEAVKQHYNLPD